MSLELSSNKGFQLINHLSNRIYSVYENEGLVKITDNINKIDYYSNEKELQDKSIDDIVEERSNEMY